MAEFKRLKNFSGQDIFVNVELVQAVTPGRGDEPGQALIHFGANDAFLVQGAPEDVIDILWPPKQPQRLSPPG